MSKPPSIQIAKQLAEEFAPDLLPDEEDPFAEEDQIIWDAPDYLIAGQDVHDGVAYMTFPLLGKEEVKVGKGKDAPTVERMRVKTWCVTSTKEIFLYDEDHVGKRGFQFPPTFVTPAVEAKWKPLYIQQFLKGNTTEPDPMDIYRRIRKVFETYVEYPEDRHYDFMTLYTMVTFVFPVFESVAYVHFNGTMNSGKSQNLNILDAIAFNPVLTSSITSASLFRMLASNRGTILFDEAETWDTDKGKDIMPLVKQGYKNGAKVYRTEKDGAEKFIPLSYTSFGPKVFASINPQDPVLGSRSIIINMRPAFRTIPGFRLGEPKWDQLRNELFLFSMYHIDKIDKLNREWEKEGGKRYTKAPDLLNRQWEVANSILIMADYVGGDMLVDPMYEWFKQYYKESIANMQATDKITLLMRCLPRVMATRTYIDDMYYSIKDIHDQVSQYLDEDAKEYYKTRTVMRHLTSLGFNKKKPHKDGTLVQLVEEQVKKSLLQRRIEPFEEDHEWLNSDQSIQTAPPVISLSTFWTQEADDEEEAQPLAERAE